MQEQKEMTTQEAYANFYAWIRADVEKWNSLEMKDRRYLRKIASEARLGKPLGTFKIEKIFNAHAPGRYALSVAWGIKDRVYIY